MLPWANMFNQSMFFHRRVFEAGHFLDESQHHFIDHDFFWRLILAGYVFGYCPELSATFRLHELAKGSTQHEDRRAGVYALYKRLHAEAGCRRRSRKALVCLRNHCVDQFGSRGGSCSTNSRRTCVGRWAAGPGSEPGRPSDCARGDGQHRAVRRVKHLFIKPRKA